MDLGPVVHRPAGAVGGSRAEPDGPLRAGLRPAPIGAGNTIRGRGRVDGAARPGGAGGPGPRTRRSARRPTRRSRTRWPCQSSCACSARGRRRNRSSRSPSTSPAGPGTHLPRCPPRTTRTWLTCCWPVPRHRRAPWLPTLPAAVAAGRVLAVLPGGRGLAGEAGSLTSIHLSNILDWLTPEAAAGPRGTGRPALKPGGWVFIRQLNSTLDIPTAGPGSTGTRTPRRLARLATAAISTGPSTWGGSDEPCTALAGRPTRAARRQLNGVQAQFTYRSAGPVGSASATAPTPPVLPGRRRRRRASSPGENDGQVCGSSPAVCLLLGPTA